MGLTSLHCTLPLQLLPLLQYASKYLLQQRLSHQTSLSVHRPIKGDLTHFGFRLTLYDRGFVTDKTTLLSLWIKSHLVYLKSCWTRTDFHCFSILMHAPTTASLTISLSMKSSLWLNIHRHGFIFKLPWNTFISKKKAESTIWGI